MQKIILLVTLPMLWACTPAIPSGTWPTVELGSRKIEVSYRQGTGEPHSAGELEDEIDRVLLAYMQAFPRARCRWADAVKGWRFAFVRGPLFDPREIHELRYLQRAEGALMSGATLPPLGLTFVAYNRKLSVTSLKHELGHIIIGRCFGLWDEASFLALRDAHGLPR